MFALESPAFAEFLAANASCQPGNRVFAIGGTLGSDLGQLQIDRRLLLYWL
jgi:hypothetical protein